MTTPILLLDFARTGRFDRRLTFTRPSPAWRTATAPLFRATPAGQPRLTPAGLLVEPAATNIIPAPALDQPQWALVAVTASPTAAPDGSLTAWRVSETAVPYTTFRVRQLHIAGEGMHTASVYVKAAGRSVVRLRISTGGGYSTVAVNLADGSQLADSAPGSTVTAVGDGWYRLTVSRALAGGDSMILAILAADTGPPAFHNGDPARGVLLWGMQLEAGATASSLTGTGGTTPARAAESCSLPLDRLPRWTPNAGTLLVEAEVPLAPAAAQTLATLSDPGGANALRLRLPGGTELQASAVTGGVAGSALAVGAMVPGNRFRAALAWNGDGLAACLDGGAVASGGPGAPGGLTALHLGHAGGGGEHAHCRFARVTLYPERVSDAALRRLTQA